MTLLVFALLVLVIAVVFAYLLRLLPVGPEGANVGGVILLLIAVLVIAQRAGIGL